MPDSAIEKELNELKEYREFANSCTGCQVLKIKCDHLLPTLSEKIAGLFQASCATPMVIVALGVIFSSFVGISRANPN